MKYKVGDIVILDKECMPAAWAGLPAEITHVSGDLSFRYTYQVVAMGGGTCGMHPGEIERLANDVEILTYKLTL